MFNLPTPKTAVGKFVLRAGLVALIAVLGLALNQPEVAQGSLVYLIIKGIYDTLNSNINNI